MSAPRSIAPVVLLVQPYRDDREMYAEFLRHSGLTPIVTSNAITALAFAPGADVIVTGLRLEGTTDGVELITRLKGCDSTRKVPIIVLTSCAWASEQERARTAGCDLLLTKPCLPDHLLLQIRRVLLSAQAGTARRKTAKVHPQGGPGARRRPPKRAG